MKFKAQDDYSFKGKRVLLESDLNSPMVNGKVLDNWRIKESAVTIKELKRRGAGVVDVISKLKKWVE
jgi:3-phosphoglycerate kinase